MECQVSASPRPSERTTQHFEDHVTRQLESLQVAMNAHRSALLELRDDLGFVRTGLKSANRCAAPPRFRSRTASFPLKSAPLFLPSRTSESFESFNSVASIASVFEGLENTANMSKPTRLRKQVWRFIEDDTSSCLASIYHNMIVFLILLRMAWVLTGENGTDSRWPGFTVAFTALSCFMEILFVLDVLLRLISCPHVSILLMSKLFVGIDICCALPLILRIALHNGWWYQGIDDDTLQLAVSIFFVSKMLRRFDKVQLVSAAFTTSYEALPTMFVLLLMIVCAFSTLIYTFEPRTNVGSASDAIWMVIVTMSTVGFGDLYPVTNVGRAVTTALICVSTLYMTIPIGIVGHAFTQAWDDRDRVTLMQQIHARVVRSGCTPADLDSALSHLEDAACVSFEAFISLLEDIDVSFSSTMAYKLYSTLDVNCDGKVSVDELLVCFFPFYNGRSGTSGRDGCSSKRSSSKCSHNSTGSRNKCNSEGALQPQQGPTSVPGLVE
eukprot:TRINITY_DN15861_c0_g1_i1.p1 TRINITY_DN15861_c0_g1~~TRINITY_DN15861_c0_g1_i1.p1  ORF type:complete len:497 (+),score=36.92 TRINITY_DN15861_c0_g1_i1:115-1605(+)